MGNSGAIGHWPLVVDYHAASLQTRTDLRQDNTFRHNDRHRCSIGRQRELGMTDCATYQKAMRDCIIEVKPRRGSLDRECYRRLFGIVVKECWIRIGTKE